MSSLPNAANLVWTVEVNANLRAGEVTKLDSGSNYYVVFALYFAGGDANATKNVGKVKFETI